MASSEVFLLHELDQLAEDSLGFPHCFINIDTDGLHMLLKHFYILLCVLVSLLDVESCWPELSLPLSPFCYS